jgi:hypothetical protein
MKPSQMVREEKSQPLCFALFDFVMKINLEKSMNPIGTGGGHLSKMAFQGIFHKFSFSLLQIMCGIVFYVFLDLKLFLVYFYEPFHAGMLKAFLVHGVIHLKVQFRRTA